jgi:hypothetical protein
MSQIAAINVEVGDTVENITTCLVSVIVGDNETDFTVTVDDTYHKKIDAKSSVKELVKKSFEFLLDREPPEQILKFFSLSQIETYFPTYPIEIKNY